MSSWEIILWLQNNKKIAFEKISMESVKVNAKHCE